MACTPQNPITTSMMAALTCCLMASLSRSSRPDDHEGLRQIKAKVKDDIDKRGGKVGDSAQQTSSENSTSAWLPTCPGTTDFPFSTMIFTTSPDTSACVNIHTFAVPFAAGISRITHKWQVSRMREQTNPNTPPFPKPSRAKVQRWLA